VLLEHRRDCGPVGRGGACDRPELFEELVGAAWGEDHGELGGLVGEGEERVLNTAREIGEPAFFDDIALLANLDLVAALDGLDQLILRVVDMQGGPP
jgi:hypothetical protein